MSRTRNKEQARIESRESYLRNKDRVIAKAKAQRANGYGLSVSEYDAIIAKGCEACGAREGRLCVDHCHETGRVRGCLCVSCNRALGFLGDDPKRMLGLLNYIEAR